MGLNVRQTFKGILADPESREKWVSRFTYRYVEAPSIMVQLLMVDTAYASSVLSTPKAL